MPAPYTIAAVAQTLGGTLEGDASLVVKRLVHPLEADRRDDLIFVMVPELALRLGDSPVRAAVLAEGIQVPAGTLDAWITVPRPRYALGILLGLFESRPYCVPGVHPSAVVEPGAELGDGVCIGALAYIGPNARIGRGTVILSQATVGGSAVLGENCLIYPGVRIGERVEIGNRVTIHNNASIGADGFSYVTPEKASFEVAKTGGDQVTAKISGLLRIASIGTVRLGDDVEIGACAAVDRANIGATVIGRGTKLDNHVQIGHNVRIGEDCLFSGQVAIAGSAKIGNRVVLAGKAAVADHLTVGDDVVAGAGTGIWRDVKAGQVLAGFPALPKTDALRQQVDFARLPRLLREVAALKRQVAELLQGRSE
jgi:UDP-3-O-[3-hydroxymyristoyl] glucosamine N-acyltransferase